MIIYRIGLRGREFEQDQGLMDYYKLLWQGYDNWVTRHCKASDVLMINIDNIDVVNNSEGADYVKKLVKEKLDEMENRMNKGLAV
ncbi:deoxynucleoside kinase [Alkalibacterium sp. 20]|uniref:deoxynucleoside kinase n=1 Tax=Alkalibacterium sp. 20 TaxID=1798803 RepID=UPI000B2A2BA8